jgi:bifunctional DNA-binding transcriptional regulator/antitoxin component of YhaV-PrlF toxin-antitoxin module
MPSPYILIEVKMAEILMTMSSKGQVTIPAAVRQHLKITERQKIALVLEADGSVRLKLPRYQSIADLRGAAGQLQKSLTWKDMRAIAHEDRITLRKNTRK